MNPTQRLREWLRPGTKPGRGTRNERWVVVDTETSGLDPVTDRLLAIGAVTVDGMGIRLDDSFEVVMRSNQASDKDNVVIHGIGHEAQSLGVPAADALGAFALFVADAPCVGFHSEFDQIALAQCANATGVPLPIAAMARPGAAGGRPGPRPPPARQTQPRRLARQIRHRRRGPPHRGGRRPRPLPSCCCVCAPWRHRSACPALPGSFGCHSSIAGWAAPIADLSVAAGEQQQRGPHRCGPPRHSGTTTTGTVV